jgi:hypothetical protein
MTRVTKLAYTALIALMLAVGAAYTVTLGIDASTPIAQPPPDCPDDPTCDEDDALAGDPSQWGAESAYKRGSFDITETETSEDSLAAGDEKNGDVPVVPGLARKVNEYEGQHLVQAGDSSEEGAESVYKKGSFDIT